MKLNILNISHFWVNIFHTTFSILRFFLQERFYFHKISGKTDDLSLYAI